MSTNILEMLSDIMGNAQVYSEPCQTSKIERFSKPLTIFSKYSILVVWQGSEHATMKYRKQDWEVARSSEFIFEWFQCHGKKVNTDKSQPFISTKKIS